MSTDFILTCAMDKPSGNLESFVKFSNEFVDFIIFKLINRMRLAHTKCICVATSIPKLFIIEKSWNDLIQLESIYQLLLSFI